ncbi:hypothetical protein HKD37_20G056179 [Glycine soja]
MDEKKNKQLEEAAQSKSTDTVIDPSSPIRRHVKWKMARTKKTDSLEEQASQGSFVAHGRQDGLALPPEPEVGPSVAHVSTKESCVDPSGNDPDTDDLEKCGLYVEENTPRLVALGRLYEGLTTIHSILLRHDQVKVGVEEVRDADAPIPIPTKKVQLVGQTLNTFIAWLTRLVKRLSEQPLQIMWDAIVFGDFNDNFPLYIKHEGLFEIAHDGQCLSISVIQLWILPDNYLKGIIISALKRLNDTLQSKSKVIARWIVVKYFNDARPLEPERLKGFRFQWATYYLKVKNETISV